MFAGPRLIDAEQVRAALPMDRLIDAPRDAFVAGAETPPPHRHALPDGAALPLMSVVNSAA
jgi:hypothetical protein